MRNITTNSVVTVSHNLDYVSNSKHIQIMKCRKSFFFERFSLNGCMIRCYFLLFYTQMIYLACLLICILLDMNQIINQAVFITDCKISSLNSGFSFNSSLLLQTRDYFSICRPANLNGIRYCRIAQQCTKYRGMFFKINFKAQNSINVFETV